VRPIGFLLVAILGLACGDSTGSGGAGGAASPTPAPIPDVVVQLMDRVALQTAYVKRIDRITARLEKWGDFMATTHAQIPGAVGTEDVWVIAAVGEFYPAFGMAPSPPHACARWVYGAADLQVRTYAGGSLAACAPYFTTSLVPPDAPVACGPEPDGYSVFDHFQFSRTLSGSVPISTSRDGAWTQPAMVSGMFLYEMSEGSASYYETFCRNAHSSTVPKQAEVTMLTGLGSPKVLPPPGLAQIWLKGLHAIAASASDDGVVTVQAERRTGFEIVSYDWHALAPDGGYVKFRFVGPDSNDLIPYTVANGP
jgi:hypothetical protein